MLKEIFHDSFENFEITRICVKNHPSVTGWSGDKNPLPYRTQEKSLFPT